MNKISKEIQEELLQIAPTLARLRESNARAAFTIPPHYSETLTDNVLAKIKSQPLEIKAESSKWAFKALHITQRSKLMAVAATFIIATMLVWLAPKTFNSFKSASITANAPIDYSQLNEEDIRTLIHDSKTELDTDFLTDKLGVTEKELSWNTNENAVNSSDDNMNDAIDKYIKENDTNNSL